MAQDIRIVPEKVVAGKRLGAHYKEDDRNQQYALAKLVAPVPVKNMHWQRHIPIMNQNINVRVDGKVWHGLGSCCPNSLLSTVSTGHFKPPFENPTEEGTIVPMYEAITQLMGGDYVFPPHDSGAFILDAMNYAYDQGWIGGYNWCYSLDEFLQALMRGPCQIAIGWKDSFDWAGEPHFVKHHTGNELVATPKSEVRGWHAMCADQVVHTKKRIWYTNQWGKEWCREGRAFMTYETVDYMFKNNLIQVVAPTLPAAA